jgi:hypothetical protein
VAFGAVTASNSQPLNRPSDGQQAQTNSMTVSQARTILSPALACDLSILNPMHGDAALERYTTAMLTLLPPAQRPPERSGASLVRETFPGPFQAFGYRFESAQWISGWGTGSYSVLQSSTLKFDVIKSKFEMQGAVFKFNARRSDTEPFAYFDNETSSGSSAKIVGITQGRTSIGEGDRLTYEGPGISVFCTADIKPDGNAR